MQSNSQFNLEMYWKMHFLASVHSHHCGTFLGPAIFISSILREHLRHRLAIVVLQFNKKINYLFYLSTVTLKTYGTNLVLQCLY